MNSFEFNKIAGGVLVALLLVVCIDKLSNILYAPELPEHAAVETEADAHSDADVGGGHDAPEVSMAALLAGADLEDGEGQFKKCKSCHTIESGGANGTGPNLYGIVGNAQAHSADFGYSAVLSDLGGTWTFEELDAFLTSPKTYANGTKMTFRGISDGEDRANLIAWLNTQSDAPLALPAVAEPVADEAAEDMTDTHDDAADAADDAADDASDTGDDMMDDITEAADEMVDDVSEAADDAMDSASDALDDMSESATDAIDDMTGSATDATGGTAVAGSAAVAMIAAGSVEDGESVSRKCSSCHTFDEGDGNRVGPNLWNVVDKPIASDPDYSYSDAMEAEGGNWTYDRLWTYLMDPKAEIPGTKMGFRGISDEEDLASLILYMRDQSNEPTPLPGAE
ncbi:MAG: cytochrome c family protein [Rhodospirillaceae bacterium]|nr:cytochrome c family protein [Rhodospirillaceae bacterium]